VIVAVFAATMVGSALGMFWRHDAGMLARLPIDGTVLLRAALVRAARSAAIAAGTAIAAAAPIAAAAGAAGEPGVWDALGRGALLIATLTIAAAALTPASAAAAALLVAGGTIATMAKVAGVAADPEAKAPVPSTTALGALPGTAAAWMVILAITVRWWMFHGGSTAIGPALPWLGAAAGVSVLALATVWKKGAGMAVALREVAALDRQRLAHLEIHPPRGLERGIMNALGPRAALVYSRAARLMRRRYPMAWALGLVAWVIGLAIGLGDPGDAVVWTIGLAAGTAAYALALALRLSRPPVELPRLAAQLPVPDAAHRRARVAWMIGWLATFGTPPTVIATFGAHTGLVPLAVLGAGAVASVSLAARG
jgi:hypothetical protein